RRARVEAVDGRAREALDARDAGAARGGELAVHDALVLARRLEEPAVQALEAAVDPLLADDRLHEVDRRGVARGRQPRALLPVQPLQLEVAVVERGDEV